MARERLVDPEKEALTWEVRRKECGFANIVGQEGVIKRLREFAAFYTGEPGSVSSKTERMDQGPETAPQGTPGHILFVGPDGMGKQTIARAFAAEYCGGLVETDAAALTRAERERTVFLHPGSLFGVLTNLAEGDAVLIAGIDGLPKHLAQFLFQASTDRKLDFVVKGLFAKTVQVPLKPFVLLATARSSAACSPDL